MADISAIFGLLLALGLAFPGLLAAVWLLFPATVELARLRLERTPWRCFWLGGVLTAGLSLPITVLLALPSGAAKFAGAALITLALTGATLGAAGLAAKMGAHLAARSPALSPAGAFLRGAVALELAAFFPIMGWFIVIPLAVVVALGATAFALLKWMPRTQPVTTPAAESSARAA
jgi:hypothetical protein